MENVSITSATDHLSPQVAAIHGVVLIFTTIAVFVANILALVILPHVQSIPVNNRLFFMSLAIAELGNGALYASGIYPFYAGHFPYGSFVCRYGFGAMLVALTIVSTSSLLALNMDRYIAIVKPFKYATLMTRNRVLFANVIIWVAAAIGGISFSAYGLPCSFRRPTGFCVADFTVLSVVMNATIMIPFCLPSTAMIVIYGHLLHITHTQIKAIQKQYQQVMGNDNQQVKVQRSNHLRMELKNICTFLSITIVHYLVWMPYYVINTIYSYNGVMVPSEIYNIVSWFSSSGSWLIAVILMGSNEGCRKQIGRLLKNCLHRRTAPA